MPVFGSRFRRQVSIGRDARRTLRLKGQGRRAEVVDDPDGVLDTIHAALYGSLHREHDPKKLQTFRTRSCGETST